MADTKISAMPEAATLDGTEIIPIVQTGDNVQQTLENTIYQTFQVTQNIGLNTTSPNGYGPGWSTLTVGGVNTNNPSPSGGEIDIVGADGSTTWLYQDGLNFNLEATTPGSTITISSPINTILNTALRTNQLTGYLYGNGSSSDVTASATIPGTAVDFKFGSFHQATTLTNTTPGTGIPMRFGSTDFSNGITIQSDGTNPTYITVDTVGTYNFQFSAQLNKNGGGGAAIDIYIWMNRNGVAIPATNTRVTLQGANVYTVAAWNFFLDAAPGDNMQLMWASASANAEITALTPAIGPSVPAAILTVNQINSL